MNTPVYRSFSAVSRPPVQRMMGVVLPVVLVVLTILTGLVVTQIRRSTIDERLAASTRESVHLDSSVQTVLRWCEARVTQQPQGTVTVAPAPDSTSLPAWDATSANWNNATSLDFQGGAAVWGLTVDPSCVIEDATCELAPPISPTGQTGASACPGNGDLDPRWRKFRITARVVAPAADMIGGNRTMYAQSELRLFIE